MAETLPAGYVPQHRHGASIGQPLTRRDGLLKVTGQARYAADNHPPGMLHAVLAVSTIARGRVSFLDVTTAKADPGVVEVMTPANRPPLALDPDAKLDPFMFRLDLLQNDRVRYAGQPIAVMIAETLEAATEAATLLSPRYEAEPPRIGLDGNDSFIPPAIGVGTPPEVRHGDVDAGLAAGGFGSKGMISGPQVLGILAARLVGRPVKLVLRREQMYGPVGHRAPTRQTLRLGADRQGALTAIHHHVRTASSSFDDFFEPSGQVSHSLYASPAIATTADAVRLDTGTPIFMRAPGEASGSIALESAIDEMAQAAGIDPLEFRLKNYAEVEPVSGKPFSSKALRECYAQGAARFGWQGRTLARRRTALAWPWNMMAGKIAVPRPRPTSNPFSSRICRGDGTGLVELGAQDMGQGAWTALAQIAADSLGLELEQLELRSGSSDLPDAGIAGGSSHTATAGMAIHGAGAEVIAKLAELAMTDERSPLFAADNAGVLARGGRLYRRDDESRSESYADILARAGVAEIEGRGSAGGDPFAQKPYAMYAHGAVFAEVKVDPELGQVRATRLVGAFAAGTIINPRLVRSQYYGGMIWGVSFALHERAALDPRSGRVMNANLAEYHVPVNADVPSLEAILVEETDPHVNALGIKGVGEIGITGTAGAIANAVWHATGVRVRRFPITLEQLIGGRAA